MSGSASQQKNSWVWSVPPLNAAFQAFSTLAPLYVLHLGGGVVQVSLVTTVYHVALIPASIFWGSMTDRLARRRFFFVFCYVGSTIVFFVMYLLPTIPAFALLYGALGMVIGANSTAASLLIMETSEKKNWMHSYGRLSLVANIGAAAGLAVGLVWTTALLPLGAMLLFCSASTVLSIILSFRLVPEPQVTLESSQLSFHPLGYASRIYHSMASVVQHVITPPTPKEILRVLRAPPGPAQ